MRDEELLAHIQDLIRTMPTRARFVNNFHDDDVAVWSGRVSSVMRRWKPHLEGYVSERIALMGNLSGAWDYHRLRRLLIEAREDLALSVGAGGVVIPQGQVFEYFNEVRKLIEGARTEVFIVDPYLNPDVVEHYMPSVVKDCGVRLLGSYGMPALLAAVDMFARQSGLSIAVRQSKDLHDRYIIIDGAVYVSGASFKDGAKNSPSLLSAITDALPAVRDTYEKIWQTATVQR